MDEQRWLSDKLDNTRSGIAQQTSNEYLPSSWQKPRDTKQLSKHPTALWRHKDAAAH